MSDFEKQPQESVLEPRGADCVEVLEPRTVPLGGPRAMTVYRTLPQRERSLVGAWCFLDHYGPDDVGATGGMAVPQHPHTGLATVSWLFTGRIDHLDSAGNAAAVLPGELNLMIAGRGITHSEFSMSDTTTLHGVQLWYALPESTRFSEHGFAHYAPPAVDLDGATVRVFLGDLVGSRSPVDTRTPDLLGAELVLEPGASVDLDVRADFEHAVLAETSSVVVDGVDVPHRSLAYLPTGVTAVTVRAGDEGARIILLGGVPLDEQIVMWWNFIGRDHDEIVEFRRRYQAEMGLEPADSRDADAEPLFGPFPPDQPAPLPAPACQACACVPDATPSVDVPAAARRSPASATLHPRVLAFHGAPTDDLTYLLETVDPAAPAGVREASDDAIAPHWVEAGCPHARFVVLDRDPSARSGWRVTPRAIDYPADEAARLAEEHGRPDIARALTTGRV